MTQPLNYAAAALYGLGIERALSDGSTPEELLDATEDAQRQREDEERDFTYPDPLADWLE